MVAMDEISLLQKFINLFLLMGGMFGVFYYLIYGTLKLGVVLLGRLVEQPDDDASFFDGGDGYYPGLISFPSRRVHRE